MAGFIGRCVMLSRIVAAAECVSELLGCICSDVLSAVALLLLLLLLLTSFLLPLAHSVRHRMPTCLADGASGGAASATVS